MMHYSNKYACNNTIGSMGIICGPLTISYCSIAPIHAPNMLLMYLPRDARRADAERATA